MIHDRIGGDIAEIETVTPYTGDYNDVVDQGQREVNEGFMPAVKPIDKNPADYDTVILGTPVWWYTFAPAVKTFLSEQDLSGKKVYPFITNGGWIGHTVKDIETACRNAAVKQAIDIKFNGAVLSTSASAIEKWIGKIE
jgi:Multimeric flavodoxin WrbA